MATLDKPILYRFWKLLKSYNRQLSQIYTYGIVNGLVNLSLPLGIQAIITFLQVGEFTTSWVLLVLFVIGGIGLSGYLQVMQLKVVENVQQDIFVRSSIDFAFRLPKIDYEALDRYHAPEMTNRFFDTMTIQKGLPKVLIDFSLALFQIVFGLLLLIIYSPYFVILPLIMFVVFWVMRQTTGRQGFMASLDVSKYKYSVAHWLEEIARVRRVFKLNVRANLHMTVNDKGSTDYIMARQKLFGILLKQYGFFIGLKLVVATLLLILGGVLVFNDQMNIGQFVAAEIIVIMVIGSFEKMINLMDTVYDVLTGLEKIGMVTDMPLDNKDGIRLSGTANRGFSFKASHLSYAFPGATKNRLNDVSFQVESNQKVVVRGETGKGKSVLLHILAGLYEVKEGELLMDGVTVSNYCREDYLVNVGFLTDTNDLFEGSVWENITMGKDISMQKVEEVLAHLELEDFVKSLPKGIDSKIESGGRKLPTSIVQKLQIAREVLTEPRLLLIEEVMMPIRKEEKRRIIDYLTAPERPWTLFVISDDQYWCTKCDQIIEL